ncbi:MAG TPA: hypothetical protein DD391_05560 [Clostridiales bacterium]|nr:hypothetical protein [Clostridiales bacterium]HBL82052.1 hypothetical protein [Clostridiales bacterium]
MKKRFFTIFTAAAILVLNVMISMQISAEGDAVKTLDNGFLRIELSDGAFAKDTARSFTFTPAESGTYALFALKNNGASTATVQVSDGSSAIASFTHYCVQNYSNPAYVRFYGKQTTSDTISELVTGENNLALEAGKLYTISLSFSENTTVNYIDVRKLELSILSDKVSLSPSDWIDADVGTVHVDQQMSGGRKAVPEGYPLVGDYTSSQLTSPVKTFRGVYFTGSKYLKYTLDVQTAGYYTFTPSLSIYNNSNMVSLYANGLEDSDKVGEICYLKDSDTGVVSKSFPAVYLNAGANDIYFLNLSGEGYFDGLTAERTDVLTVNAEGSTFLALNEYADVTPQENVSVGSASSYTANGLVGGKSKALKFLAGTDVTYTFDILEKGTYSVLLEAKSAVAGINAYFDGSTQNDTDTMYVTNGASSELTKPMPWTLVSGKELEAGTHSITLSFAVDTEVWQVCVKRTDIAVKPTGKTVIAARYDFIDYVSGNDWWSPAGQVLQGGSFNIAGSTYYNIIACNNTSGALITYKVNVNETGWYDMSLYLNGSAGKSLVWSVYADGSDAASGTATFTTAAAVTKHPFDNAVYLTAGTHALTFKKTSGVQADTRLFAVELEKVPAAAVDVAASGKTKIPFAAAVNSSGTSISGADVVFESNGFAEFKLNISEKGDYMFFLTSTQGAPGSAQAIVDGVNKTDSMYAETGNLAAHTDKREMRIVEDSVTLDQGEHTFRLEYANGGVFSKLEIRRIDKILSPSGITRFGAREYKTGNINNKGWWFGYQVWGDQYKVDGETYDNAVFHSGVDFTYALNVEKAGFYNVRLLLNNDNSGDAKTATGIKLSVDGGAASNSISYSCPLAAYTAQTFDETVYLPEGYHTVQVIAANPAAGTTRIAAVEFEKADSRNAVMINASAGTCTFDFAIEAPAEGVVVMAVYSGEELVGVVSIPVTEEDTAVSETVPYTGGQPDSAKLFIWNNLTDVTPLVKNITVLNTDDNWIVK